VVVQCMESYSKYTSNTVLYSKKFCCDRGDERHSSNTFHSSNPALYTV
jgi:hypothetical protein